MIPKKTVAILLVAALFLIMLASAVPLSLTGNTLTVYVKSDGSPVSGASVRVAGPTMPPSKTTGASGYAQFTGLDAGDYTVRVYTEDNYAFQALTLSKTTSVTIDLAGPPIIQPGTGAIRGKVFSQDGNTILPGAKVIATLPGGYSKTVTADSNGDYYMELQENVYSVYGYQTGGFYSDTKSISVITGGVTYSNFLILNGAATIDITVKDEYNSNKITGAELIIDGQKFTSDTNGIISINDWFSGTYDYTLSHPSYLSISDSIIVSRGANTLSISMTPINYDGVYVSGSVLKLDRETAVSGAVISFQSSSGTFTTQTLLDGSYNILVPSGTYTVSASAIGFNETSYTGNPLSVSNIDISNVNIYMDGDVPPTDGYIWTEMGYLAAIGGIIVAVMVFVFIPIPPKYKALIAMGIALTGLVSAHLFNTGVI